MPAHRPRNRSVKSLRGREDIRMPKWLEPKLRFLRGHESREDFLERIAEIYPLTDPRYILIQRAYDSAEDAFKDKRRDNGEQYFEHLRAVALILIIHLRVRNAAIIAAALLHDIDEDIREWPHARVVQEFGDEVGEIVWWVTKPKLKNKGEMRGEIDRRYHSKLSEAPRVAILVKLADRLHNLLTIWRQESERVRRKIDETRDFLLPLAEKHQILIHELEDVLRLLERKYKI